MVSLMEPFINHSEVENEVGEDFGQTECDSVANAEHSAPRIHNPKNSNSIKSSKYKINSNKYKT